MAASIKMRKCDKNRIGQNGRDELQCGRIYKDAEIRLPGHGDAAERELQCGRIYKDAEIMLSEKSRAVISALQCGRIYKDAEIRKKRAQFVRVCQSFNVAASIKMRKFHPLLRLA